MKQLRLAGSSTAIRIASLGGYHDGSKRFMRHLRLVGSSIKMSFASLDGYQGGSRGFIVSWAFAFELCVVGDTGLKAGWVRCRHGAGRRGAVRRGGG